MPNKDPAAYREYMRRYMRHRRRLEWLVHPSRRRTAILAREGADHPNEAPTRSLKDLPRLTLPIALAAWATAAHAQTTITCGTEHPCTTTVNVCEAGMPCSMSPEDALRRAYDYCRADYYDPPGESCAVDPKNPTIGYCDLVNHPESYTLPACKSVAKRWEQSEWKKRNDADAVEARRRELDHARAFIDAVAR